MTVRTPPIARSTRTPARLAAWLVGVSALALGASPAWAEFRLNVLHLNDPHSRIEPINRFDSTCSAEDDEAGECFGGFARLKTLIEQRREALEGPTVVVSAGDHFQGSLFYTTYKGAGEAEMAEALGIELFTVGNHEFDDGPEELAAFLDGVSFPVLGGNVDASGVEGVEGRVDPYVIAEFDDGEGGTERVGFVGVVASDTAETSSPGPIEIGDDLAALQEAVAALETQGVNKIIAVTHVGLARDRELAAAVPEIDLFIGGHSHTLMLNEGEEAEGAEPYPVVVDDTPIVQAYAYGKYLGELVLRFDDDGNLQSLAGDPILVDASVEKDATLEARIQEMLGPIEELKAMEVGETTAPIDGDRTSCRAGECEMGNLVADAMLDRVRDQGIDVAIQNGGGLRASIDAGTITMGEVLTVLPFQNTLATFRLSGADIVASLENGVSGLEEGEGRFPQVAGMSYRFDPSAEVGGRISDVTVGGEPIDPERLYGVTSNNFMRGGGDGYELFETNAEDAYDFGPGLEQVLADYIANNGPITPALDGRIQEVGADAAPVANEEEAGDGTEDASAEGDEAASDEAATDGGATDDAAATDAAASATAELEAADAATAINEAVEGTVELDPLAEPPAIADGEAAEAGDAAATETDVDDAEEAVANATEEPTADTEEVQEAVEAIETDTDDGADDAASAEDGASTDEAAGAAAESGEANDEAPEEAASDSDTDVGDDASAAAAVVGATEEPTANTEAVQEAVEDAAGSGDGASAAPGADEGDGEAAEAINEAVESDTEFNPLAEPPAIDAAPNAAATTEDAEAASGVSDVEAASADDPTSDDVTASADAATDTDTTEDAASADAEATDAADDAEVAIEEAAPAPTSDTEAVQDAVEAAGDADATEGSDDADATADASEAASAGDEATDEAGDEATEEAVDAINDAVDTTAESDALADPPSVETQEATGSAASVDGDASESTASASNETAGDAEAAINGAVDATTNMDALATPPAVETADDATASDEATAAEGDETTAATDDAEAAPDDEASTDDGATDATADTDTAASDGAADTASDGDEPRTHTVRAGDTLWELAREFYGDATLFTLIVDANEGVAARGLRVGREIVIPERPE